MTDINDNPPTFRQPTYNVTIPENATMGTIVAIVTAEDMDIGDNALVTYSLISGSAKGVFAINQNTGVITLKKLLNWESQKLYVVFIIAEDGVHRTYVELTIYVTDVNEHEPYFLKSNYSAEVAENLTPGSPLVRLLATDKDGGRNSKIIYSISDGDSENMFTVTETGIIQSIKFLDYERNATYDLFISIRDDGIPPIYAEKQAHVRLNIRNTNDNRPLFTRPEYSKDVKENTNVLIPKFIVSAKDSDDGTYFFID